MIDQHSPHLLHGQFILCQKEQLVPPLWTTYTRHGWILAVHPRLRVVEMTLSDGTSLGWLIGYPISPDGVFCPDRIVFPQSAHTDPIAFESHLYRLGGRFVSVLLTSTYARLYLDAGGSLPVVYSLSESVAGTSPSLFETTSYPWDTDLIQELEMPQSGLWYPFGLTPRKLLQRLLPNHFLDLRDWRPIRHWPIHPCLADTGRVQEHIATIISSLQRTFTAVAQQSSLYLSLTAGRDTRLLLACAHQQLSQIGFFTFTRRRVTADSHIAQKLARRWGLQHIFLPIEYGTPEQLDAWLYKTGACVSGEIWRIHTTLQHLEPHRPVLSGAAGEVGRAFYWRESDNSQMQLSAEELVGRCHLPTTVKIVNAAETWLEEIRHFDPFLILDLLYLEQRIGCWASLQQLGSDDLFQYQLMPFVQRDIFESMLQLPTHYRFNQQLVEDICYALWPELLELPFNDYSGIYHYPAQLARWAFEIARKLRAQVKRR